VAGAALMPAAPAAAAPAWSIVPSANPPGPPSGAVFNITCPAPTTCFAIARTGSGGWTKGIVEQWDGPDGVADVIVCLDSFEHFERPADILRLMHRLLKPGGSVEVAFGPPWYHPYGGHLFSVFPYAHLLFSERALVTWRGTLPGKEPKTSFLDAGLNKMTVRRFEQIVRESPFRFTRFEAVPIRKLRPVANRLSREFTTSIVRCRLEPRP